MVATKPGFWEVHHMHMAHPRGCVHGEMMLECSFQVMPHISHFFPAASLILGIRFSRVLGKEQPDDLSLLAEAAFSSPRISTTKTSIAAPC